MNVYENYKINLVLNNTNDKLNISATNCTTLEIFSTIITNEMFGINVNIIKGLIMMGNKTNKFNLTLIDKCKKLQIVLLKNINNTILSEDIIICLVSHSVVEQNKIKKTIKNPQLSIVDICGCVRKIPQHVEIIKIISVFNGCPNEKTTYVEITYYDNNDLNTIITAAKSDNVIIYNYIITKAIIVNTSLNYDDKYGNKLLYLTYGIITNLLSNELNGKLIVKTEYLDVLLLFLQSKHKINYVLYNALMEYEILTCDIYSKFHVRQIYEDIFKKDLKKENFFFSKRLIEEKKFIEYCTKSNINTIVGNFSNKTDNDVLSLIGH